MLLVKLFQLAMVAVLKKAAAVANFHCCGHVWLICHASLVAVIRNCGCVAALDGDSRYVPEFLTVSAISSGKLSNVLLQRDPQSEHTRTWFAWGHTVVFITLWMTSFFSLLHSPCRVFSHFGSVDNSCDIKGFSFLFSQFSNDLDLDITKSKICNLISLYWNLTF